MNKAFKKMLSGIIILSMLMYGFAGFAAASTKSLNIIANSVTINYNSKAVKVENFSFSNNIYIQPQDISSIIGIDYSFNAKTMTVTVKNQKPAKPVTLAKTKFSSLKAMAPKKINVSANVIFFVINGKKVAIQSYFYDNAIFVQAKAIADALDKEFVLDEAKKKGTIKEKKPTIPTLTSDTLSVTEGDVIVTIENWGSAVIKEYKIDSGSWQKYTAPIAMTTRGIIYARGTNSAKEVSGIASLEVNNIRKLLNNKEVARQKNCAVKVVIYDVNGIELGNGSGFIVSSDGTVVTNYHVIDMKTVIKVITYDKKTYNVSGVLAYSKKADLAVLKLETNDTFSNVYLGDSDAIELGEDIVAMGHPLGLELTVSSGIVSSLDVPGGLTRTDLKDIQITAPTSVGSSGGPVFNMYGEIIGIIYSGMTEGQNLNFAIPVNELKTMLSSKVFKQFSNVIHEVYPTMNYDEYAKYLYYNYPNFITDNYTFNFDDVFIEEYDEDPNEVDMYLHLYSERYAELLLTEKDGNKAEVDKWLEDMYNKAKIQFPNKEVWIGVYYVDYFNSRPDGFTDDEVTYDSETKEFRVVKLKIQYYVDNGTASSNWY